MEREWTVLQNSGKSAVIESEGSRKVIRKPTKVTGREFVSLFAPESRMSDSTLTLILRDLNYRS
jgi:hypothetical protein